MNEKNSFFSSLHLDFGTALKQALRGGYNRQDLRADILAGCVVGVVALPLSMALAIASGVAPQHGLYTAIVAGFVIAVLGGSRFQVSGPTAAFVVILAPISAKFGPGGLFVATLMAGVILVMMGITRLGRFMEFVPYPVTAGFTAGIGVVIATLQLKDFFGLSLAKMPEHYTGKVVALAAAFPTWRWQDLSVGVLTFSILLLWPRFTRRVPAPLVALTVATLAAALAAFIFPEFSVATIRSRFSYEVAGVVQQGIPPLPPMPVWPWNFAGGDGQPLQVSWHLIRSLINPAFAIAMLGAIESLLSAVVADGMTGARHEPNTELLAQGVGNIVSPFFGGFSATGAIARTATGIRSGARSPISAAVHAIFVLLAVVALAPALGYLPMASLAALLLLVAWNMSEAKHFIRAVKVAPKSDVAVLLVCFSLTVIFDMVVSVTVGVMLAALLFMNRMAQVSSVRLVGEGHHEVGEKLPSGLMVYEIIGPLFFGAAQRAVRALETVKPGVRVMLIDLRSVPAMDATGLFNLQSMLARLKSAKTYVLIGGVQPQPLSVFARAKLTAQEGVMEICSDYDDAFARAKQRLAVA